MEMADILVMLPGPNVYVFLSPLPEICIWKTIRIDPVVLEKKSFAHIDRQRANFFSISHSKTYGIKFDLAVK